MFLRKMHYLTFVTRSQWLSREDIEKFQFKRLKFIIEHAYKNTRFYRKLFDANRVKPTDFKKLSDINKFPVITREQIMENYPELITQDFNWKPFDDKLHHSALTAGSSGGHSFRILANEKAFDFAEAVYLRSLMNVGYKPWDKIAYYWYEQPTTRFYNKFGLMKKQTVPATLSFDQQIALLKKINPEIIYYFGSILYIISKIVGSNFLNLKVVITHAELLSEKMRRSIGRSFNCNVYDQYGTSEFVRMAWECKERTGYHIDAENVFIEVLDDNHENLVDEPGNIITSGLWNTTLPLIRYKIGDVGAISDEECSCGRGLPLLKSIEGRKNDLIKIGNKVFTPKMIIDSIDDENVYQFKFDQIDKRKFDLYLSFKGKRRKKETIEKILIKINELLGGKIKVNVYDKELLLSKRGKFKLVNGLDSRIN